jgi:DNA-binding SARP family transcriptional activator/tetratricopeptide (TPR) repeat protein
VHGLRRKTVLAVLALHGGGVVSTGQLTDAVWGDAAPPAAMNSLQNHVSYLRGVLGSKTAILVRPPGYVLDLPADGTDVQVAGRLLEQATQSADPAVAVRHLQDALGLWRGRPLADVADLAWVPAQAERLDLLRMRIRQELVEARLAVGEHVRLVPELEQMVADNPLDERVHGQLMLALYRSGRQADALAVYHRLRQKLGEELGIDPGRDLRDLETAVLRQDPSLDRPEPEMAAALVAPVPAQLPPAVSGFAGRVAELASLDAVLPGAARPGPAGPAAVVISAVSGTAGVGKTTLAVHWAHRVAGQFPDGQLYVNLRGFDPAGAPVDPAAAVRGFLDALGVAVARIPQGLDAQAALYRSVLAGKRVLVVLDNARDAAQVRPLLPGSPGCLALVTSRNQLPGLVAAEGARPLALDLLTPAEAHDLLTQRLGAQRVASEPGATREIIQRCARLPLALAIAAARATTSPSFSLAAIAAELRRATVALDPFDAGERAADVRAVFSWSYDALTQEAARLFRLLGLHPGPDVAVAAAASLAAVSPERARVLLAELARAHLLTEHTPGRFAFHDLLRAYATEQAHSHDSHPDRDAAVHRVLDHYLHTAHHAATLSEPYYDPPALTPAEPGVVRDQLTTAADALGWFTAEHATLLAAVHLAATGFGARAWQLAWCLSRFLLRGGMWHEQARMCQAGLEAARRTGDITGQAHCLHQLASGYNKSGRYHDAGPLLEQALELFETMGDQIGQAYIHGQLGLLASLQQHNAAALGHDVRALDLYRTADHPGQALMLNHVGYSHALLGNYQQALTYCEQALAAARELGERNWEAATWDSLGYIHQQLGDHQQAITCYERSLDLYRERADRYNQADTLDSLGDVHRSAGDTAAARRAWTQALRIFDEIGHPDSDPIRAKLRVQGHPAAPPGRSYVAAAPLA